MDKIHFKWTKIYIFSFNRILVKISKCLSIISSYQLWETLLTNELVNTHQGIINLLYFQWAKADEKVYCRDFSEDIIFNSNACILNACKMILPKCWCCI